jgi:hypothetical protein
MATVTKDMWVANLVESWRGDQSSVPVHEFFESIDEAAEMGRLSAKAEGNSQSILFYPTGTKG